MYWGYKRDKRKIRKRRRKDVKGNTSEKKQTSKIRKDVERETTGKIQKGEEEEEKWKNNEVKE